MDILIFETNVSSSQELKVIKSLLTTLSGITAWFVDLHTRDRILRIESTNTCPKVIETTLRGAGFRCQHLLY